MNDTSTVDEASIETLRALMKDRFSFLIDTFLENTAKQIGDLQIAINNNSNDDIISIVHAIKGSCGSVGATRMHALGKDYEELARTGDLNNLNQWPELLTSELNQYKNDIQTYL